MSEEAERLAEKPAKYKSGLTMTLIVINITLSSLVMGYYMTYLGSIPIETVLSLYHVTFDKSLAQGILNGCVPFGALFGAILSSLLIKYLSRRYGLLFINLMAFAAGWVILIPNMYCLILGRLVQGICVGLISSVVTMIVKEISPTQLSGTYGAIHEFNVSFAIVFNYLLVYILIKVTGDATCQQFWLIIFTLPFLSIIGQTIILVFAYPFETPKYLLQQGLQQQARQLIEYLYRPQYCAEVLEEKKEDLLHIQESEGVEEQDGKIGMNTVMAFQLGILLQFTGINVVVIYASEMLKNINSSELILLTPTLLNVVKTLGALLAVFLLSHVGRKSVLQVGLVVTVAAHSMTAIGYLLQKDPSTTAFSDILIITGSLIYMSMYGFALGSIIWLYIPQVVSPKVLPATTTTVWAVGCLIVVLFPIINNHLLEGNSALVFFFFAAVCFCSFLFNQKVMVESMNKTEKQIRQEYKNVSFC